MAAAKGDILVVEDDPDLNELIGAYVQLCGFGYRAALDGAAALRQALEYPAALVLLDLMLPDIDGFEVCKKLKSQARTRHIPIVMLTALDGADSRQKGVQCGAVEYITKPFDPEHLMTTIRKHAGDK